MLHTGPYFKYKDIEKVNVWKKLHYADKKHKDGVAIIKQIK